MILVAIIIFAFALSWLIHWWQVRTGRWTPPR